MSAGNINSLLDIWASSLPPDTDPPFADHEDLYNVIDATEVGDAPWKSFTMQYNGELGEGDDIPSWKTKKYEVWYRDPGTVLRNQLGNPDFKGEMDFAPKRVFNLDGDKREYCDFMSGNWAWKQAVGAVFTIYESFAQTDVFSGQNCSRSPYTRRDILSHDLGERQNYSLGSHRSERLLSVLPKQRSRP